MKPVQPQYRCPYLKANYTANKVVFWATLPSGDSIPLFNVILYFFRETKELASSIICDLVLKHFFSFKLTELRTVNLENTET